MILTVENHNLDKKVTHSDTIFSMCEHYIEVLEIGNYDCMLNVVLHQAETIEGHLWGYCEWDPEDRIAEIHLAMNGPAWGLTLAHEMVHVKQNLQYGIMSEERAYELEYILYSSWKNIHEPTK